MNRVTEQALEVQRVVKQLAHRTILDGVSLQVEPGQVAGLLGPNGAGKSTLFRIIMGEMAPDQGTVRLAGQDLAGRPMFERARLGLGYLPQQPTVFGGLSAKKNIQAALQMKKRPLEDAKALLVLFGLEQRADQLARTLSGGERRRVELARLWALSPSTLLLDEPFKGLDRAAAEQLAQAISQAARAGARVLLTDHHLEQAASVCHKTYWLSQGKATTPKENPESRPVKDPAAGPAPPSAESPERHVSQTRGRAGAAAGNVGQTQKRVDAAAGCVGAAQGEPRRLRGRGPKKDHIFRGTCLTSAATWRKTALEPLPTIGE